MYNKLLISAGGGIISRNQQADQDNCATIAIGLGGTGISCLRALKKEVYTRVKPDDASSLVARYRHIKYLAVDTDKSSVGDNGAVDSLDSNAEFFNISCPDIAGLLGKAHLLAQDPSLRWLKTKGTQGEGSSISILSAEAGAGGIRQVGRLLLLQNCKAFVTKLENIITEALKDLADNPSINIHIFTGMSGGTGAGTFLDVCYILQHVLKTLGKEGAANVCGYFFLPDVNLAKKSDVDYVPINGFAAMKELDYTMNYHCNGGQWDQQYDGFRVTTSNPPVKLAHLISATNSKGQIRSNGYDYAMHVVVDYVLEYIIKPYIPSVTSETVPEEPLTIKSHIANVETHIGMVNKKHGASYHYCVLGAANAYLPYKDITTYLAAKIFESFRDLPRQKPADADVDAFMQSCQLTYSDIFRDLVNGVPGIPHYDVDIKTLFEQTEGITNDIIPQILVPMRNATAVISGKLAQNQMALLNDSAPSAADSVKQILALSVKVKEALIQIAVQPEKGPYYACRLLYSTDIRDIRNRVHGYAVENQANLNNARNDLTLRDTDIQNALRLFQNSTVFTRKGRGRDYVNCVHAYFMQSARIDQMMVMANILSDFETQLNELYTGFFSVFEDMMRNLQATFDSNLTTLSQPVMEDNSYAVKLMTIQDLQQSLDKSVANMRRDVQIHDFVHAMLSDSDIWIDQDENKICDAVTNYFLLQLGDYTQRTLMDYLQIKFGTTAPSALQAAVYKEIILPLDERARPLFWTDTGYKLTDAKYLGYLSIPNISDVITAAAETYKSNSKDGDISVRTAWFSDRIAMYNFRCGIPMFGYKGVANYKSDYKRKAIVGSHIYEGSAGDSRDSRNLVDIAPISYVNPEEYTEAEKQDIALYGRALAAGVLCKEVLGSTPEYRVNVIDEQAVQTWMEQADQILDKQDITAGQEHLARLEKEGLPVKSYRVIENTSEMVYAEQVIRDHVVDSLSHMQLLREQLAIFDRREEKRQELQVGVQKWSAFVNDMHNFAWALSSGVIHRENDYSYVYTAESFGMEERRELTNIDKEPFGMALPLYSAYLGFIALTAEEKSGVEKTVKHYLVYKKEVTDAAVDQLRKELSGEKINAKLSTAKVTFPEQTSEITSFFKRLAAEFNNFAAMR